MKRSGVLAQQAIRLLDRLKEVQRTSDDPVEFTLVTTRDSAHISRGNAFVCNATSFAFEELDRGEYVRVIRRMPHATRFILSPEIVEVEHLQMPPDSSDANRQYVEELRDILIRRATGGSNVDEADFRALRERLRANPELRDRLPDWLRSTRTLDDWWGFIKPKFPTYAERQTFVSQEFDRALTYLEDGQDVPASLSDRDSKTIDAFIKGSYSSTTRTGSLPPPPGSAKAPKMKGGGDPGGSRIGIFIVHGRDHGPRDSVARLVDKLGFEAIILEEQPSKGRTIIEKFEAYTDVPYAVVVMTPDDVGSAKGGTLRDRARQNVVLELGFFVGKLGRQHVAAIVVGDVELPSDVEGVIYIRATGDWKTQLAREMRAAGLAVDMNKI
jgi:hypothetical protein